MAPNSSAGPGVTWSKMELSRVLGVGAFAGDDGEDMMVLGSSIDTAECCESWDSRRSDSC